MRIFPFRALLPDKSVIASPASFHSDVKRHYRNYIETGHFNPRKKLNYFAYQIKSKSYRFHGFLATFDIDEIISGNVLAHENTLHHKEQTSMQLMLEREAIIKPLLLTYKPQDKVSGLITRAIKARRPVQSFYYSNIEERHSIWPIQDQDDEKTLTNVFKKQVEKVYIADGHHRVSVLGRLHRDNKTNSGVSYEKVVSAFFDFDNLQILDYNRIVDFADSSSAIEMIALLSHVARITPMKQGRKPNKKFEITFYLDGMWFLLEWKKKVVKKYDSDIVLDATILNDELLGHILGIRQVESDNHIQYVNGDSSIKEIESRVDRQFGTAAFCLYPVSMQELCDQADKGKNLPPKSTFFKPRLPNGFVSLSLTSP